jgi:hypothetical protein
MLVKKPYEGAQVNSFVYHISVKSLWCHPWDGWAALEVVDSIPEIDGKWDSNSQRTGELPAWQRTRYRVICMKSKRALVYFRYGGPRELMEPETTPHAGT